MSSSFDRGRAFRVFEQALGLTPEERPRFVRDSCGGDAELAAEVEALLAVAAKDGDATGALLGAASGPAESLTGRQFGHFRLVERLGEGGMGVVYRAERTDGLQQSVAIKLIARELAGSGQERFQRETQVLARLEHPAIAHLIDAGIESGRAWIALEFVRGKPIDEYCDASQLDVRQRVRLLVLLASAVAAAHRMLVVHRDIKPANVLVTADGLPKLIDFGIAATLQDAGGRHLPTLDVGRLFTPHYAAPEQVSGEPITVATDIFGLGALGFRLLTGQVPYSDAKGPVDYLLAITQRDAEPASSTVTLRGGDEREARQLRGDLDAILQKALERDPARRYGSAADLQADLQRYLDDLPVAARAPSPWLRAAKFARRNAVAVSLTALLGFSVIASAVVTTWLAISAQHARRDAVGHANEARAVTDFLINDILAAANPLVSGTRDVQLRPLLDAASTTLETRFAGQPTVLAELQAAMGEGYAAIFETRKAEGMLLAAEKGLSQSLGDTAPETQNARMALWDLYTGNIDIANLYKVSQRIALAETTAGRLYSRSSYRARVMLAWIPCVAKAAALIGLSDCGGVVQPFYVDARARLGADDFTTKEMEWLLGVSLMFSAQEDRAEPLLRDACAGFQHHYGPVHRRLTSCRRFLAWALDSNGKFAEALPINAGVVRDFNTTLGPDSQFTTIAQHDLARVLIHIGDFAPAAQMAREAIAGMERGHGLDKGNVLASRLLLADAQVQAGQSAAGLALGEQALSAAVDEVGAGDPLSLKLRDMLGTSYLHAGKLRRAEALRRENLALGTALPRRPEWYPGELKSSLAQVLVAEHRGGEARPLLEDAVQVLNRQLGPENPRTRAARATLQALP